MSTRTISTWSKDGKIPGAEDIGEYHRHYPDTPELRAWVAEEKEYRRRYGNKRRAGEIQPVFSTCDIFQDWITGKRKTLPPISEWDHKLLYQISREMIPIQVFYGQVLKELARREKFSPDGDQRATARVHKLLADLERAKYLADLEGIGE